MNSNRICIVDDNDDIREIYRMKFQVEGFETVTASNGQEALEIIRGEHPAVVLLDIQMPVMDGLEVLGHLRADPSVKDIPVVILSNIDSEDIFQKVSDLGSAEYYLVKSLVDPQRVVDVTIEALAASKNQQEEV
jgi:chemosensory pili system protein ChpA (sensor histidine kinase/response regulator)